MFDSARVMLLQDWECVLDLPRELPVFDAADSDPFDFYDCDLDSDWFDAVDPGNAPGTPPTPDALHASVRAADLTVGTDLASGTDLMSGSDAAADVESAFDSVRVDNHAARLLHTMVPGVAMLELILTLDPEAMSGPAVVDAVAGAQRLGSWMDSIMETLLAAVPVQGEDGWENEDVSVALSVSPGTARVRLGTARMLAGPLALTHAALAAGDLTLTKARLLVTELHAVDDAELCALVQAQVLPLAGEMSYRRLQNAVRRLLLTLAPVDADTRHAVARARREVRYGICPDGMASLSVFGPAEDVAGIWSLIDATAHRTALQLRHQHTTRLAVVDGGTPVEPVLGVDGLALDEDTSMAALRFDALAILAFDRLATDDTLPRSKGRRPGIEVVMSIESVMDDSTAAAYLTGYGWIAQHQGQQIAADRSASFRRLLTDPVSGTLLDYGRTKYRPPVGLAEYVMARDRACIFPNCPTMPIFTDIDHVLPWQELGATRHGNLGCVCRRHHRAKHDHGWALIADPSCPGAFIWTSPSGRVVRRGVQSYLDLAPSAATTMATSGANVERVTRTAGPGPGYRDRPTTDAAAKAARGRPTQAYIEPHELLAPRNQTDGDNAVPTSAINHIAANVNDSYQEPPPF
jgi:hypothetical protein